MMMAMNEIFPEIHSKVAIAELFPTQVTVGMREVDIRRLSWREKSIDKAVQYLGSHRVPVVIGPNNRHYMVDRHHLTTALYEEGMSEVPVSIIGDFNKLGLESFWTIMESRNWTHPFDDEGHRCPFDSMPTTVANLTDYPFRSLAGAVKRAQGYAKNKAPFSEFRWADFLRSRIARTLVERDFGRALAIAMNLAQGSEAAGLPGWQRHPLQ